jgi:hypothetical protein
MNLDYAVDRLYLTGWTADECAQQALETLPDGRAFPSLPAIEQEFARAGLSLSIQHTPKFNCYRASWTPSRAAQDASRAGTVIGACQREAAVYALAQLRNAEQPAIAN